MRRWSSKRPADYRAKAGSEAVIGGDEILDASRLPFDFMLNALRLNAGVPMTMFEARTGLPRSAIAGPIALARSKGWLEDDPDWLRPTELGRRFTNDVIGLFLPRGKRATGAPVEGLAQRIPSVIRRRGVKGTPMAAAPAPYEPIAARTSAQATMPRRVRQVLDQVMQEIRSGMAATAGRPAGNGSGAVPAQQPGQRCQGRSREIRIAEQPAAWPATLHRPVLRRHRSRLCWLGCSVAIVAWKNARNSAQGLTLLDDDVLSYEAILNNIASRIESRNSLALAHRASASACSPALLCSMASTCRSDRMRCARRCTMPAANWSSRRTPGSNCSVSSRRC